jgi:hypothetical protein
MKMTNETLFTKAAARGLTLQLKNYGAEWQAKLAGQEEPCVGFGLSAEDAIETALERQADTGRDPAQDDFDESPAAAQSAPSRGQWYLEWRWTALAELAGGDEYVRACAVDDLESIALHCPDARLRRLCFDDLERLAPRHPRRMKFADVREQAIF